MDIPEQRKLNTMAAQAYRNLHDANVLLPRITDRKTLASVIETTAQSCQAWQTMLDTKTHWNDIATCKWVLEDYKALRSNLIRHLARIAE